MGRTYPKDGEPVCGVRKDASHQHLGPFLSVMGGCGHSRHPVRPIRQPASASFRADALDKVSHGERRGEG